MCYNYCYNKDSKWRYSVRRKAKIWLPITANILMLVLIGIGVTAMIYLIDLHLTQTVKLSALKSIQIQASTISELQQNDIMLTNSGLQATAKTISQMLSNPEKYTDQRDYLKEIAKGKHVGSGYEYAKKFSGQKTVKDTTKNAWYMMPKEYDIQAKTEDKKAFELCGFAQPFLGTHLDQSYANLYGPSTTYFGLDTGFHCVGPMSNFKSFVEPVDKIKEPEYDCPRPGVDGWENSSWYSPVCRGWYKNQTESFRNDTEAARGIMTDLYQFAGEDVIGLTSCAPLRQFIEGQTAQFRGAVCLDIAPMGPLNQYFDFDEGKNAHYLIYSPNDEFEEQDVYNYYSDFKNQIEKIILKDEYNNESIKFSLNYEAAKLFDDEKITWGELSATKKGESESSENYLFIATDLTIKFPDPNKQILDPNNPIYGKKGEDVQQEHKYKLVFFSNESELIKEVEKFRSDLKSEVYTQFITFLLVFMIIFCIVMTFMLFKLANAITRPVIELYELIKHIVNQGKGKKMKLSYKPTNFELNNLHKTFNKIATTLQIAKSAQEKENPSTALLNYYEANKTFKHFENIQAQAMCLNNIGVLHFNQGEFIIASGCFKRAVELGMNADNQENAPELKRMGSLVRMSRTFQQGFSLYSLIHQAFDAKQLFEVVKCKKCQGQQSGAASLDKIQICKCKKKELLMNKRNSLKKPSLIETKTDAEKEALKRFNSFQEVIKEAIVCFKDATEILAGIQMFADFRCVMALCALELIIVEKVLHAENLDRSENLMKQMREEDYDKFTNYQNWISQSLRAFKDNKVDKSFEQSSESSDDTNDEKQDRRFGFQEFQKEQIMQYKYFLKGFFFQAYGCRQDAVLFYKKSLMQSKDKSWNWCRQSCLENLQLYTDLTNKPLILTQLRKHVVHKRSIIFLLDNNFDQDFYMKQANRFVCKMFDKLDPEDRFGYICIGDDKLMPTSQLQLEKKCYNQKAKESFLRNINQQEHLLTMHGHSVRDKSKLSTSLQRAIEWQQQIDVVQEENLGIKYDSPHMWIVALIGSDQFNLSEQGIKHFEKELKKEQIVDKDDLKRDRPINISIIGLSQEPMHKESTKRYNKLTESTKEGIFVNIVDKDNCEHVIENVELVMAIHKKDRNPIVTELTESALQN